MLPYTLHPTPYNLHPLHPTHNPGSDRWDRCTTGAQQERLIQKCKYPPPARASTLTLILAPIPYTLYS